MKLNAATVQADKILVFEGRPCIITDVHNVRHLNPKYGYYTANVVAFLDGKEPRLLKVAQGKFTSKAKRPRPAEAEYWVGVYRRISGGVAPDEAKRTALDEQAQGGNRQQALPEW